jgi:hypothetical protein
VITARVQGAAPRVGRAIRKVLAALLAYAAGVAPAQEPPTGSPAALQARHLELQTRLRSSAFGEPLLMTSRDASDRVEGDVYAEVARPFAAVGAAFGSPATVCELLILHLNVHACQPSAVGSAPALTISVGPKRARSAGPVYDVSYALHIDAGTPGYAKAELSASQGPLSTSDYRIFFEAVPIDGGRSFVHFGYGYGYGAVARMAMSVYLATAGRSKIGFTVLGQTTDGQPIYIGGERASLERNVMRYYLALLAYSGVDAGTPRERMDARMRAWFDLTERHKAQLHELDLDEYLKEKQAALAGPAAAVR